MSVFRLIGRNGRRFSATVVLFAVVAVACGGGGDSGIEYKDPDDAALFTVPADWHLYESDELASLGGLPFVTNFGNQLTVISQVAFDGAPGRAVSNLGANVASSEYPIGSFVIRGIGSDEREAVSRTLLEQSVLWPENFNVDEDQAFEEDFEFSTEYEGIRRFLPFRDQETQEEGLVYFISVTDPTDTRIFSMAAGCSTACWEVYGEQIVEVVDSWLVNTNQ